MSEGNGLLITHISRFCTGVSVRQWLPGHLMEVPVPRDPHRRASWLLRAGSGLRLREAPGVRCKELLFAAPNNFPSHSAGAGAAALW